MTAATLDARRPLLVSPEDFRPDPHASFARLRRRASVLDMAGGYVLVIRHADVERLMTDPATRQIETEPLEFRGISNGALHDFYANSMLVSNAPAHARRRGPTARAFAFKLIEAWRPRIRALVRELIDAQIDRGGMDLTAAIAAPLPSRLIAEVLGAPSEDAPHFARMVYTMTRGLSGFRDAQFPEIEQAASDLTAYVAGLLEARRADPRDDFLTDYVRNVEEAGLLSDKETLAQIVTLIIGGSDTTRFTLTAMIDLLLRHRDQWDAVCADAGLAPGAVREALRYEPAIGSLGRVATEALTIDGVPVEAGTVLVPSILSAQRDESVFADPQAFDIRRTDHPRWSVTFGGGPHRCLGEALARAELEEALIALSQRLPDMRATGDPVVIKGHTGIRGISPLSVRWGR